MMGKDIRVLKWKIVSEITPKTNETDIFKNKLDGTVSNITRADFFDHMLIQIARHVKYWH